MLGECTDAYAVSVHAVIDPGDEVLIFEPAYETYQTCIELARGVPVCLSRNPKFYFQT